MSYEITRTPSPITLCGVFAPTLSILCDVLQTHLSENSWIAADLSLGAWQSNQIARDCLRQLGCELPPPDGPLAALTHVKPTKGADMIGVLIDAEGSGDLTVSTALNLAECVLAEMAKGPPRNLVVIMPRFGMAWRQQDLLFLEFLAQGLHGSHGRLVLAASDAAFTATPDHWRIEWLNACSQPTAVSTFSLGLLSLVPGLAAPEIIADVPVPPNLTSLCLKLPEGDFLIGPECRQAPSSHLRLSYDKLGTVAVLSDAIKTYAQLFGNNYYCNPTLLIVEAWQRFAEGGFDIALDLMTRLVTCTANLEARARFLWELQGMRIALQRFDEAKDIEDPPAALPTELRGGLLQTKGWALTILGQAAAGNAYLAEARELLEPTIRGTRQFLYLNNIYALSRLKIGDPHGALDLEKQIETDLEHFADHSGRRDWPLTYVNSINQARLYRILKDFQRSHSYYSRAFGSTLGVRSESDLVYTNVCLAGVLSSMGRYSEAFSAWFRAGIHWAATRVPEALALRVKRGILRRNVGNHQRVSEEIAHVLRQEILTAGRAAGIPLVNIVASHAALPPVFRKRADLTDRISHSDMLAVVCAEGWSIIASQASFPVIFAGPENQALCELLWAIICSSAPEFDFSQVKSVLTDDQFGQDLSETLEQALNIAVRLRIAKILYPGRTEHLSPAEHTRLEMSLIARPGPAISQVNTSGPRTTVAFKRYLSPRTLSESDSQFLRAVGASSSLLALIDALGPDYGVEGVVIRARRLENERVINLEMPLQGIGNLPGSSTVCQSCGRDTSPTSPTYIESPLCR